MALSESYDLIVHDILLPIKDGRLPVLKKLRAERLQIPTLVFETNTKSIHDQLYLPKGSVSLEDILLTRRRLATDYDLKF